MNYNLIKNLIFTLLLILSLSVSGVEQDKRHTVRGQITDAETGEDLYGATIQVQELSTGTISNRYGFFSFTLPEGVYELQISFISYETKLIEINLNSDKTLNIRLSPAYTELDEVVITDTRADRNISDVRMSTNLLPVERIRSMPAFMGETDILKAIQMLPGVSLGTEGSSGFFVRGGGQDQNMILLDEAPVYNASHLLGFFSVFNPDAIRDVQLYKGGIPAQYGGRLSSVLDIRMKEGNNQKFGGTGGIGTISSRLTLEGPLQKDVSSFIVSGRRTYADLFLPLADDPNLRNNQLFFYDLNAKANYRFNDNNRLFVSGYFGRDVFRFDDLFGFEWGNATSTVRWNHIISNRLFSNFTFVYSNYDYNLYTSDDLFSVDWTSHIENINFKGDFTWYPNPDNEINFGFHTSTNSINPGQITGMGNNSSEINYKIKEDNALEHALYISNEHNITEGLTAEYGLRYSLFQNIGEGTYYSFDDNYNIVDTTAYEGGEIFHNHHGAEPRISLVYQFDKIQSVKANYNRTRQYVHQATNSTTATPLDIWFPSSPNVAPQIADQWAVGYFRNFYNNMFETSVELYYKDMQNQIDFREHARLILNPALEGELRIGDASSYGIELMLNKTKGDFTGWISYTLSKTERKIPEINQGKAYPAAYDRPHDLSIVLSYDVSNSITASANWVYHTGRPVTMPIGKYEYQGVTIPIYSDRNAERLPDYHRLDLSLNINSRERPERSWQGEWNFSVYNAYFRKNVFSYYFEQNEDNPNEIEAYKIYMFGIIPAVSYNFNF